MAPGDRASADQKEQVLADTRFHGLVRLEHQVPGEAVINILAALEREIFGKRPAGLKHREWLWRRIAWKIQEQRFGGLSTVAKRRLDELIADLDLPLQAEPKSVGRMAG